LRPVIRIFLKVAKPAIIFLPMNVLGCLHWMIQRELMHWGTLLILMVLPMLRPTPRARERYLRPPWPCAPCG
jgi:hypothetical protein